MVLDDPQGREKDKVDSMNTRERIIHVALEVFAEKGVHGATVVEIAKRAGVTGGALYRYFESKEDIFQAVVEQHSGAFAALDMVRGLMPELEPKTALKFLCQGMFLYFYTELDFMRLIVGESLKNPDVSSSFLDTMLLPARDFTRECIDLWQQKGLLCEDVDPDIAASAFLGMVGFFMVEQAFFSSPESPGFNTNELAERFSTMFLEGILKRE